MSAYKAEVLSCKKISGTSKTTGKPYEFFVLNVVLMTASGERVGGDLTVDAEVKPGSYAVNMGVQTRQGRLTPVFSSFQPLTAAR